MCRRTNESLVSRTEQKTSFDAVNESDGDGMGWRVEGLALGRRKTHSLYRDGLARDGHSCLGHGPPRWRQLIQQHCNMANMGGERCTCKGPTQKCGMWAFSTQETGQDPGKLPLFGS